MSSASSVRAGRSRASLALTAALALLTTPLAIGFAAPAQAVPSTGLMISALYGAGGNSGATWNADFVELYNASADPISLSGKSLQYRSAAATTVPTNIVALPTTATVPAHSYYLVGLAGGTNGAALPATPDFTATTINMSATAGQLLLADATTGVDPGTGASINYGAGKVIDFVGFGTTAATFETAVAPAPSTTTYLRRKGTPPADNDNNSTDFSALPAAGATLNVCACSGTPAALSATNPGNKTAAVNQPMTSFTLQATGGTTPYTWSATGLPPGVTVSAAGVVSGTPTQVGPNSVTATVTDATNATAQVTFSFTVNAPALAATNPGARSVALNEAMTPLTLQASGGTAPYSWSATGLPTGLSISSSGVITGTPTQAGTSSVTATVTDAASGSANVTFSIRVAQARQGLVISEVYGANQATNIYNQDFVEIHNTTGAPIELNGLSVQYRSATGTGNFSGVVPLSGFIPGGGHYLVGFASTTGGTSIPTSDVSDTSINLSGTAGTVALARRTTALTAQDVPVGNVVGNTNVTSDLIDLFGYGTSNTYEGAVKTGAPSATSTAVRLVDTDDNNADFVGATLATSPAASPTACDCTAPAGLKITEVYTEGGKAGATYANDYIEIQNTSGSAIALGGPNPITLQYRAPGATGPATVVATLAGNIPAGAYDVARVGTPGAGTAVPGVDYTSGALDALDLDAAGGTLMLVKGTAPYDPSTGAVAANQYLGDLVGWGNSNAYETTVFDSAGITVTKSISRQAGGPDSDDNSTDFSALAATPNTAPPIPVYTIAEIQGDGASSPYVRGMVTTSGVVTGSYPTGTGNLAGFYMQTGGSNDPNRSDGIFVYTGSNAPPAVGASVDVTGRVDERFGQTQISTALSGGKWAAAATALPAPVLATSVPATNCGPQAPATCLTGSALEAEREKYESEALNLVGVPFTISDSYDGTPWTQPATRGFQMHGEIGLAANSTQQLMAPTEFSNPTRDPAGLAARAAFNEAHQITLDDAMTTNYQSTTGSAFPWMTLTHTTRIGASVSFAQPMIFDWRNDLWKLQPQTPVAAGEIGAAQGITIEQNRPAAPNAVGGNLKIATFNMLNYFAHTAEDWVATGGDAYPGTDRKCSYYTDRSSPGVRLTANTCSWTDGRGIVPPAVAVKDGGAGPRGAATMDSFLRQEAKEIAAINTMNADVMSLEEVENSIKLGYSDRDYPLKRLVTQLNADWAASHPAEDLVANPRWAYVPSPRYLAQATVQEQDAIHPAFIYNPRTVQTIGESEMLVNSAPFRNAREPLAQAFMRKGGYRDDAFLVVVNHFKSKGDSSGTASGDNVDKGDGAGSYNGDRIRQARAVSAWANELSDNMQVPGIFMAGDYNAYSHEDPVMALEDLGWHEVSPDNGQKTYAFGGLSGTLDHVFANQAAYDMLAGATVWPINANEPVFYEYSRYNYNVTNLYAPNPFRSSDHNPEIIGINAPLSNAPAQVDTVQILATNDFHGRLLDEPSSTAAGVASMGTAVKGFKAANPSTIFAMAGDIIGASTFESMIQQDRPTLEALNEVGLDVSSAGNHEFDKGYDDLVNRVMKVYDVTSNPLGGANWPYLAANVRLKSDGSYALKSDRTDHGYDHSNGASWWKALPNGKKVGFVGAVTEDLPSLVSPDALTKVQVTGIIAEVNAEANRLKTDGCGGAPCDLVIELVHEGAATPAYSSVTDNSAFGRIVAGANANVDAIVSGHTHLKYNHKVPVQAWINQGRAVTQRPVVSAGQYGSFLNQLQFEFTPGTTNLTKIRQYVVPLKNFTEDPSTQVVVDSAVAHATTAGNRKLGQITGPFQRARRNDPANVGATTENRGGESTLGNQIAEIQRWKTGAQIGFMNPGGLRADLMGSGTYPSDVTYREAADVNPFANTLMTTELTGAQIKKVLEQQWQCDPDGNVPSRPFLRLGTSAGFQFSYAPSNVTTGTPHSCATAGDRITGMWLNGVPINLASTYTVSATNFLMAGGDNFRALTEGANHKDTGFTDLQAIVDYMGEASHNPMSPSFAQHAVGVSLVSPPAAGYGAGDTVTASITSLAMTGNQGTVNDKQDTTIQIVDSSGTPLGAAVTVNNALQNEPYDEAGKATTVTFTVPAGAPQGSATYFLKGATTGTLFPITIPTKDSRVSSTATVSGTVSMTYGTNGTVTINVSPATAGGTVTVKAADGTVLGTGTVVNGVATVTLDGTKVPVGSSTATIVYSGDTTTAPSTGSFPLDVAKATPTVTATGGPVQVGQTANIAVNVTAAGFTPTGQVTAWINGVQVGQPVALLNGAASVPVGPFANAGTQTVEIRYSGDTTTAPKTATTTVEVQAAPVTPTTVGVTVSPMTAGQAGTVTVNVTPAGATGSVEVFNGTTSLGTATVTGGQATVQIPAGALPVGTTTLTVKFTGSGSFGNAQASTTVTVAKATVTVGATATPDTVKVKKDTSTIAAVVKGSGTPSGSAELLVDGVVMATSAVTNGMATFVAGPFDTVGVKSVTVRYSGDATHAAGESAPVTVTVVKQKPKVTVKFKKTGLVTGKTVKVKVFVKADGYVPTGMVKLKAKGYKLKPVKLNSKGKAVVKVKLKKKGTVKFKAIYGGDARTLKGAAKFKMLVR